MRQLKLEKSLTLTDEQFTRVWHFICKAIGNKIGIGAQLSGTHFSQTLTKKQITVLRKKIKAKIKTLKQEKNIIFYKKLNKFLSGVPTITI